MYFIEKINALLKDKKMNKHRLSVKTGVASSTITDLMKGRIKSPSIDLMSKIAFALDVSLDDLMGNLNRHNPVLRPIDFKQPKGEFVGRNLQFLRGSRTYEEYAAYLKEKGGESGIDIDPYFLRKYESGKDAPDLGIIEYVCAVEGIHPDFFYGSMEEIAVKAMKNVGDGLDFMDPDVKAWVKDPANYSLILLAYNTYKTVKEAK